MEQRDAQFRRTLLLALVTIVVLAALSYVFFDRPAAWFAHGFKHTVLHTWAGRLSLLANHTLVFAIAAFGFCLAGWNLAGDTPRPWAEKLLYVCLSALAAIAVTETVKYAFGRCRPELLFDKNQFGFTWFSGKYLFNSFPSGHTTRIFALCTATGLICRRLALPLMTLAVLVGISRVFALKHYPSDVLVGMFVGVFIACWLYVIWQKAKALSGK